MGSAKRATNHVKICLEFVVRLDDRSPFSGLPNEFQPNPDIHKLIAHGLHGDGRFTNAFIEPGAKYRISLHYPTKRATKKRST